MLSRLARALVLVVMPALLAAQSSGAPPAGRPGGAPASPPAAPGEIRGKVVSESGASVPNGSVAVRRGSDTAFVGGALLRPDGTFLIDGLRPGRYSLRVRALGFAPLVRDEVTITPQQPAVNLGALTLARAVTKLEEQVVTAERDAVQLAPERNSYDVKKMATASGGTAVDALRNVPSVEVDVNNQVSLRGNANVVVQINGRSSPLRGEQLGTFLAQMPASIVSRIEVAASPSAKEDPEGTAGIINIVLTEQVQDSRTAGISLGTNTNGMANVSGNAGTQTKKWTLFGSAGVMRNSVPMEGLSERSNGSPAFAAFSNSTLDGRMKPLSGNVLARTEYKLSATSALSFDAMASRGDMERDNSSYFTDLNSPADTVGRFNNYIATSANTNSQDYTFGYRRTVPPTANQFSVETRYTEFNLHRGNLNTDETVSGTTGPANGTVRDSLNARLPLWTVQSDFSHPFKSKKGKVDMGVKSTVRSLDTRSNADLFDNASGTFTPIPARTTGVEYREEILAAYGMLAKQLGKVQAQAGLRAEHSSTNLEVRTRTEPLLSDYVSLFPNGAVTWAPTPTRQLRASYSRRITRPQAPQLDPGEFHESSKMIFRGNPDLRPEYTDAIELQLQDTRKWGTLQINPYLRYSDDAMRQIRTIDAAGITTATFANVATVRTLGTDVNATIRKGKLNLVTGGGVMDYRSEGGILSTETFAWNARANLNYAFSKVLDAQVMANYNAPRAVEGGRQLSMLMTNFALRRKLWKDAGNLTARVSDPFNTMRFRMRTATGQISELTERRFGSRAFIVTFSRNFGTQLKLRPREGPDATLDGSATTPP
jgi:outer membrane receptor protein involved in Fe transport